MKKGNFTDLLKKPMTRKQFIVHVGFAVFVLSGASSFLKILSDPHLAEREKNNKIASSGFGGGSYGTN